MPALVHSLGALCALLGAPHASGMALVSGATGRTGSLIYKALKDDGSAGEVRAYVRNATKARDYLGCSACDESEGIYVGDINDASSLGKAMEGVDMLVDAVGAPGSATADMAKQIEWQGVKTQVTSFLSKGGAAGKRVVMISSMGLTDPPEPKDNYVMFYKLNAEAFLESVGVSYAIVKPCGLNEDPAGQRELMVGHDDAEPWFDDGFYMIPREDVAAVAVAALTDPPANVLRFDLCAKLPGSGPPKAPKELLEAALMPWQRPSASTSQVLA